jgi:transcriptional regulator with XRE-family HTH domain
MAHPVDIHVGERLKVRRVSLGMSQEHLGEAVGVTFQQIQKYERGLNRIGSSRLYEFSQLLSVPVSYFFDKVGNVAEGVLPRDILAQSGQRNKEVLTLVRSYDKIQDVALRKKLLALVKTLGDSQSSTVFAQVS